MRGCSSVRSPSSMSRAASVLAAWPRSRGRAPGRSSVAAGSRNDRCTGVVPPVGDLGEDIMILSEPKWFSADGMRSVRPASTRGAADQGEVARRLAPATGALGGPADVQCALGTGNRDVGEAALLGLLAVADGPAVWQTALLGARDPHVVELEALGAVDRCQRDDIAVGCAGVRRERELGEELGQPGLVASSFVRARVRDEGPKIRELAPGAPARWGAGRAA